MTAAEGFVEQGRADKAAGADECDVHVRIPLRSMHRRMRCDGANDIRFTKSRLATLECKHCEAMLHAHSGIPMKDDHAPTLRFPPPLKPGDTIAITAVAFADGRGALTQVLG
ncbi:hypothetical protein GCM10025771_08920 [Niveibacterium umoris]